ncbi:MULTISPECIES: sugar MFS transporter [Sphingobacterium]|uniref:sugar MFS transporter n=1 Tax=Sphingobacterium TaxID=28453 RepID=UPI00257A3BC6|nr:MULTISPECIES: sugar MFS transporter [Sphingobacterium]
MQANTKSSILILGVLFFTFGFLSWVNAILIPYFKIACELSHFESYLVAFSFYISYFFVSMPSSFLVKKIGYKKGIWFGFMIMAFGSLLFLPAAYLRNYSLFLFGLFALGSGLAILQPIANLYITTIGNPERAAQRISVMGICNKFAGIIAPYLFSLILIRKGDEMAFKSIPLLSDEERVFYLDQLILRVIPPYAALSILLIIVGFFIYKSSLPEINLSEESSTDQKPSFKALFKYPNLVLGFVAIFLHVGTQVIAVDTIINYGMHTTISLEDCKLLPSYTLTCTILGYILGIVLIPKFISQSAALKICSILGVIISFLIVVIDIHIDWFTIDMHLSVLLISALGLPNALIWASIWPLALKNLGNLSGQASALLIMGLAGNAILPLIYGAIADYIGLQLAYVVLIPCFIYICFYAFKGFKIYAWNDH